MEMCFMLFDLLYGAGFHRRYTFDPITPDRPMGTPDIHDYPALGSAR